MGAEEPDGALTVEAPAKINLYLEVRGRRADGYHEVVTVLQTIDLCDSLTVALRPRRRDLLPGLPDVRLELASAAPADVGDGRPVPAGADNLATRAAAAVLRAAGACDATAVSIRLSKRIPAGGGLGGGSSDAAAAALATNRLLGSPCDDELLSAVCAGLGSDVPFFLAGGTALCTGRGELVRPIAGPAPFELQLLLPPFGVPTPAVYAALGAGPVDRRRPSDDDRRIASLVDSLAGASTATLETLFRNDLQAPACAVAPELAPLLAPPRRHLSGSGSTVFTLGPAPPPAASGLASRSIRFVTVASKNS